MTVQIFSWELPLYGIMFYTGIVLSAIVACLICKKRNIPLFDLTCCAVFTMIGAMIGAKLLFVVVTWNEIIKYFEIYPLEDAIFAVIKGGFVFYGGLVGGALGLFIYVKKYKLNLSDYTDLFAAALPLGHAIGRVGCFFAGCCYGMEYHGAFSYTYTVSAGRTPLGVPLLPVQLIEAACLLLLFVGLMFAYFKGRNHSFLCTKIYAIAYSIIRFVLEFFRGDKERGVALISTSQWISIAIVVAVVVIWVVGDKIKKKKAAQQQSVEG